MKAVDVVVLARTTASAELAFLRSWLAERAGGNEGAVSILANLPRGEFVLVQAGEPRALTFTATPRDTPHVRHLKKYADSKVSPEQRFVFRHPDGREVASAESLNHFRRVVAAVEDRVLAYHAARGDFSRWVLDVFTDPELGGQLRKIEARWRRGEVPDPRQAIERLIAERYGAEQ